MFLNLRSECARRRHGSLRLCMERQADVERDNSRAETEETEPASPGVRSREAARDSGPAGRMAEAWRRAEVMDAYAEYTHACIRALSGNLTQSFAGKHGAANLVATLPGASWWNSERGLCARWLAQAGQMLGTLWYTYIYTSLKWSAARFEVGWGGVRSATLRRVGTVYGWTMLVYYAHMMHAAALSSMGSEPRRVGHLADSSVGRGSAERLVQGVNGKGKSRLVPGRVGSVRLRIMTVAGFNCTRAWAAQVQRAAVRMGSWRAQAGQKSIGAAARLEASRKRLGTRRARAASRLSAGASAASTALNACLRRLRHRMPGFDAADSPRQGSSPSSSSSSSSSSSPAASGIRQPSSSSSSSSSSPSLSPRQRLGLDFSPSFREDLADMTWTGAAKELCNSQKSPRQVKSRDERGAWCR
jgi:hypothetical protein